MGSDEHHIKVKWTRQVGAARIAWNKLTVDELLESEGRRETLEGLVQERYGLSREEAFRRVRNFLEAR